MVELLSRLNPSDLATVLVVLTLAVVGGVIAIAICAIRAVQRYRERHIAASIVAEMLDRDIPTQEIVAVLNAIGLGGSESKLSQLNQRREALQKRVHASTS